VPFAEKEKQKGIILLPKYKQRIPQVGLSTLTLDARQSNLLMANIFRC